MPNLFSNKIEAGRLQPGDHIYCYRKHYTYSHHGNNEVIHFRRTERSTMNKIHDFYDDCRDSCNPSNVCCEKCGFKRNEHRGVVKTCLNCFLKGEELYICEYKVSQYHKYLKMSGTCNTTDSFSPDRVIQQAVSLLSGRKKFGKFHLVRKNCETFAVFCKTGVAHSFQSEFYNRVLNKLRGNHNK